MTNETTPKKPDDLPADNGLHPDGHEYVNNVLVRLDKMYPGASQEEMPVDVFDNAFTVGETISPIRK